MYLVQGMKNTFWWLIKAGKGEKNVLRHMTHYAYLLYAGFRFGCTQNSTLSTGINCFFKFPGPLYHYSKIIIETVVTSVVKCLN